MAQPQTQFDALARAAHDLGITFIGGALQPPDGGRLYLGRRSLAELLLPAFEGRPIALALASGGPPSEQFFAGNALLDAAGLARLNQAAQAAGGHVYQGQLARLGPAEWLRLRPDRADPANRPAGQSTEYAWGDDLSNAATAGMGVGELVGAARAAGWPPLFADEQVLFVGDDPLYYLLMRENAGRNVIMLIGALAGEG